MDDAVRELAREAGIADVWTDAAERRQRVSVESLCSILTAMGFACTTKSHVSQSRDRLRQLAEGERTFFTGMVGSPTSLPGIAGGDAELLREHGDIESISLKRTDGGSIVPPISAPGYHRLRVADREIALAVAPARCVTLDDIAPGEKMWGLGVQLYSLRREQDEGFGDAAALHDLVTSAALEGADAIALSPTHSMFAADAMHYGPYSPSSRLFLNGLFADPAAIFGQTRLAALPARQRNADQATALIDWKVSAETRYALLRALYDDFEADDLKSEGTALASRFEAFVREGGDRLHEHALFETLHRHWLTQSDPKWSWSDWPQAWRTPAASDARHFAQQRQNEVRFHMFLQWIATESFAGVQKHARDKGMRIGLMSDVAVGMNPGGSHAWSRSQDLLPNLSIGAPPDLFNTRGQDWGLTAFSPQALLASGFEPFISTLRAAMRDAGGVRIDHAMGLARLWLVPRGASAAEGAYLTYPLDDMLRLVALESHRHRAIVIGEDLGTVEQEFRERLSAVGISGMDVLWFQREGKGFKRPQQWRREAVAMTTTHDLPTVAGWWTGSDIATRGKLGLTDEMKEKQGRKHDRVQLWRAFRKADVVTRNEPPPPDLAAEVVDAAIAFAAQSPAPLALIPIEDILGLAEQPNLPGTIDEHPNWRRRLERPASEILGEPRVKNRLNLLRERT